MGLPSWKTGLIRVQGWDLVGLQRQYQNLYSREQDHSENRLSLNGQMWVLYEMKSRKLRYDATTQGRSTDLAGGLVS
jgi:hypothetical protein